MGNGRSQITLGPVEKRIVGGLFAAFGALCAIVYTKFDAQTDKLNEVVTQQAVIAGQLQAISAQLTDIPELRRQTVELKVRVDKHDDEISELRQTRGLK